MKSIFLISFFSIFTSLSGYSQLTIQNNVEFTGLIIQFQGDYDSTLAENAQDIIENFNIEKITYSRYNHAQEKFYIKHTSDLDKVELLAIFRDAGLEPYFIDNNLKYSLNTTATALISSNSSTPIIE